MSDLPGYDPTLPARVIEVPARTGTLYQLPAYGFLEEIEIRWPDPLPNMDAGNLYEMLVERLPPGFQVFVKVRSVGSFL